MIATLRSQVRAFDLNVQAVIALLGFPSSKQNLALL